MDEKKGNIRLVKTEEKKTAPPRSGNTYERHLEKRPQGSGRSTANLKKRVKYQKLQKSKRIKKQRRRALLVLILAVILVCVLLFLTPIFNIRSVSVEGNYLVSEEQFTEKLKPLVGENLFRTGTRKIQKSLKEIHLIDKVDVQKKLFPPSVILNVTEYVPAAMIRTDGNAILTDPNLIVLSDDGEEISPVPYVTGLSVSGHQFGKEIKSDENEKIEALKTMLTTLESTGMLSEVIEIDISDMTAITMNYDNRITVTCGTQYAIDRKLRLLKESVTNGNLADNARGTMDLSTVGQAVFIP